MPAGTFAKQIINYECETDVWMVLLCSQETCLELWTG